MPAATHQHHETISYPSKKRRRDDHDHHNAQHPNTSPYEGFFCFKPTPSSSLGFPHSSTVFHDPNGHQRNHNAFTYSAAAHHYAARKHILPLPATKRLRESASDFTTPQSRPISPSSPLQSPPRELQETYPNPARPTNRQNPSSVSRCHICHRKPTRKADLDSFADCERCGERTCFVCLRECLDWRTEEQKRWGGYGGASFSMRDAEEDEARREAEQDVVVGPLKRGEGRTGDGTESGWEADGHRNKICSGCCVERGQDGDVVCYGCLPFVDG